MSRLLETFNRCWRLIDWHPLRRNRLTFVLFYCVVSIIVLNSLGPFIAAPSTVNQHESESAPFVRRPVLIAGAPHQPYFDRGNGTVIVKKGKNRYLVSKPFPGVDQYISYTVARLGLRPLPGVAPLRPENAGRILNNVTAYRYPINIPPCRHKSKQTTLFIASISAAGNFENRDRIRQTWLSLLTKGRQRSDHFDLVGQAFFVGRSKSASIQEQVNKESELYGDIVQVDMMDNYIDLVVKTVSILNWVNTFCRGVDFVLKVDDDVYVNHRTLGSTISSLSPSVMGVYGRPIPNIFSRDTASKYFVSYEEWPWSTQHTYLAGSCTMMAGVSVGPLLAAAQIMPYFHIEDTYLYGLCAKEAGVDVYTANSFLDCTVKYPLDDCYVHKTITWLARTREEMDESHEAFQRFYTDESPCRVISTTKVRSIKGRKLQRKKFVSRVVYSNATMKFDFELSRM